jgi:hypothetical protein
VGNKLVNIAGMDSATAGTGTLTLGSALPGLLTFADAGVVNGDIVSYSIIDGVNTEVGTGLYTTVGTTLARTTVTNSTNSGNKIVCSGSEKVYIAILAADLAQYLQKTDFDDFLDYGFLNQTETSIGFDGTSIFTLTDAGSGWSYWRSGVKYTISGNKTIDLLTVENPLVDGRTYYVYIDATTGALSAAISSWTLTDTKVPVAYILWNNTCTPKYWIGEERHTVLFPRRVHYHEHFTEGTKAVSVGSLTGYTLDSDVNANKTFKINTCTIADEDIIGTLAELTQPDGTNTDYVVMYRTAAAAWAWKASNMPFVYNVGNANDWIQWDSAGTMTDATGGTGANTRWVNSYLVLTNLNGAARFLFIPGQHIYSSLAAAQAEAPSAFTFTSFPAVETNIAYRLTWSTTTSTSQGKCVLDVAPSAISVSSISTIGSGSTIDHNTLAGLNGGSPYNHLTDAQVVIVNATTGTNTGDQVGDGVTITGAGTVADPFVAETETDGWIPATGTWSYSSADDPTYVISVNADMTAIIGVGQKIKLTQTTDKYFIVTAVGAYSGGNTLITVYGGTDYDLANEAVTSPYYSMVQSPFGFPMAIDKWTVTTSDITDVYQSSPTAAQWYNLGSLSISIPIGFWRIVYEAFIYAAKAGANSDQSVTLSTGNNNASDPTMTGGVYAYVVASGLIHRERFLTTGAKTTYYLNAKSSTTPTDINFRGDFGTTVIRATCAYL